MLANMSPTKGTPVHTVRVPNDEWQAARSIADRRGETLSDVIRTALRRYVQRHTKEQQ